jgi:hypothetical protein
MPRAANTTAAFCVALIGVSSLLSSGAIAQAPDKQTSPLSPPVNHESGRIEAVITAGEDGYRFRGYVLTWRSMRIVVAGAPGQAYAPGDDLDIVASRTEVNGQRVLRFETNSSASDENLVDHESTNSSASMTLGTARVEETVSAESDGYRFAGYFVTWHDMRVFVVDPRSTPLRAVNETINFQVWRSGFGANQRLSFSL